MASGDKAGHLRGELGGRVRPGKEPEWTWGRGLLSLEPPG